MMSICCGLHCRLVYSCHTGKASLIALPFYSVLLFFSSFIISRQSNHHKTIIQIIEILLFAISAFNTSSHFSYLLCDYSAVSVVMIGWQIRSYIPTKLMNNDNGLLFHYHNVLFLLIYQIPSFYKSPQHHHPFLL